MMEIKRFGAWITRNPKIIMAAAVFLTLISIHYAGQIESQGMNLESFVGKDSSVYQVFSHLYQDNFEKLSIVVLMEGDDVAKKEVLEADLRFSNHIKAAPNVVSVQSIADAIADAEFQANGIRQIPSQERIDHLLAGANPDLLKSIMPDRGHTMVVVQAPANLDEGLRKELLAEISSTVEFVDYPPGYGVTITGDPAFQEAIIGEMNNSNNSILALAGLLMVVALLLVFRHVRWPLLPIPVVFLGIIWTFGAMGFFHIPMTMVSFAAFPILIGIGIDYAIQFHNRIDEELSKGISSVEAAINTVNHVAIPVIVALIVTEAGFTALLSSSVPMIRQFGMLCIIGLVMCYLSSLFVGVTLLYNLERWMPRKNRPGLNSRNGSTVGEYVEKTASFCLSKSWGILALALVLALIGNYADTQVLVETDSKNFLPQDLPTLIDLNHMKRIFGGTDSVEFLVQADDVTDPATLKWMDDFGNYMLRSRDRVSSAVSIATYVKEANGGEMPDDKTRIREIIDSLPSSVTGSYLDGHNTAVIVLNVGDAQANLGVEGIDRLLKEYDKDLSWMPPPPGVAVTETGTLVVMATVISALTSGRVEMSLLGLVLIFLLLLAIYRDLIKALLPVLPMLVVIGWMGGVMYLGGLKYTPLTATLGALILGVGSEYAILMMERFYEELYNEGDPYVALGITSNRIGSALVASGMAVVFGFAALIASPFSIISNFGLVTVLSVIFALLTTFTVFVVLMVRMEIRREALDNARRELIKILSLLRENHSFR